MNIEKIGELYVVKARYNSKLFTSVAQSIKEATQQIFESIAIYRSLKAWNR